MAEKKRKGADPSAAQPLKKSKKNVKIVSEPALVPEKVSTVGQPETTEALSEKPLRKTRKRAADFLYDEPEGDVPTTKKGKKDVRVEKEEPASLTADGTNGAVKNSEDKGMTITTSKRPRKKSMMAEAERTQDAELADEFGDDDQNVDEEIDTAPVLLTGFDSDSEDPAEDKNFDASRVAPIPQFKKTSKKLRQAKESKTSGPGIVYIGRIPHGFYESQMREYFSQFGTISRLRLSRNKKTGASKHFAFVEFESDEVAKIVADTMDNYLMFGHILKCKYAPAENLHPDVWKGANKKYRKIPQHKLLKQKAEEPKSEKQIEKKIKKVQNKREAKLKQLKSIGYDYELPTLVKPVAEQPKSEQYKEELLAIEDNVEGALVPPPKVPKDELAVKVEEKQKGAKVKRSKKENAKKDIESAEPDVANTASGSITEASEPKKGKKSKKTDAIVDGVPVLTEEISVSIDGPLTAKGKKGKKEAVVEIAPTIIEETNVVKEAPKKGKTAKRNTEEANGLKTGKQLKSILKKSNNV